MKNTGRRPSTMTLILSTLIVGGCAQNLRSANTAEQVRATETAFAKTMADRDFSAFQRFLAKDAVFFASHSVAHGADEVSVVWKHWFDGETAPFSWAPDQVEVLASGDLALSTGPVYADGKLIARFNSVWRREAHGAWHIVFDKGEPLSAADQ